MWEQGLLGNRTRLWRSPWDAFYWGSQQGKGKLLPEIGFREIGKSGGGKWEKVPWNAVLRTATQWKEEGRNFIMDDGAPDWCRTLQGEICRTFRGLEGYLDTTAKLPMRAAMAAGHMRPCGYLTCLVLLDRYMDASSRDDLDALLELFPDATVEFSCFGIDVGIFPGRNTLFWETRNY
jgi:hypothetical protein